MDIIRKMLAQLSDKETNDVYLREIALLMEEIELLKGMIREKDNLIKRYEDLTLRLIYKATDGMYASPSVMYGGNFAGILPDMEDWLDHLKISAAKDVEDLTPSDYSPWRPDRPYKTLDDQIATFEKIIPMLTRASKIWNTIYK